LDKVQDQLLKNMLCHRKISFILDDEDLKRRRNNNIYFDNCVYRTVIQANFKVAIHLAPLEVIGQNRNPDGIV
jgi:hypothetical protein